MNDLRKAAEMALEALEKQHNWVVANGGGEMFAITSREAIQALRQALAQPEQEPVECMCGLCKLGKREWVGLTDEDVHDAFNYVEMVKLLDFDRDRPEWCEAFASACEARLRNKNGGNK